MKVEEAFKEYYEKSNEFRGYWPDNLKDFIKRLLDDDQFNLKYSKGCTRRLSIDEREKLCSELGATWYIPFDEKIADQWGVPKYELL